ncbi:hypothetical protein [Krasilnikovia sp. M28-CT-15]|uniref:hypothetical protein n=1 Tax=Krasilnikovia sp. M28-CT-15 TaxID=3373540 RepID=UPI0038763C90
MLPTRFRRSAPLLMAAGTLAAVLTPGVALADGPGYGGTADALTVQWQGGKNSNHGQAVAVYAVGFRGGSTVAVRVGATPERKVTADAYGGLRVVLVAAGVNPPGKASGKASGSAIGTLAGFGSGAMVGPTSSAGAGSGAASADTAAVEAAVGGKVTPGTVVVTVDTPAGGKLSSGTVVQAIGQSPAGSVRTLVGAVPPPAATGGVHTLIPWTGFAALLVGVGVLVQRLRSRRPATAGPATAGPATAGDVRSHRYAPRHR